MPAHYLTAVPYQADAMALPVPSVSAAIPFHVGRLGFALIGKSAAPFPGATLSGDAIRIGLAENGGDQHGGRDFQVFFVVAPDGLCFMIGHPVP